MAPYKKPDHIISQDAIPGGLDDWYQVCEDLALIWHNVINDRESQRLEDRIARTKMPYINWAYLLEQPFFQTMLTQVESEQRFPNAPRSVFAARMRLATINVPQSQPQFIAPVKEQKPEHVSTTSASPSRSAIFFILGMLAGAGSATAAIKATETPTTTVPAHP